MDAAHNALPCVTGYLADNFNPATAAVVLNEAASPIAFAGMVLRRTAKPGRRFCGGSWKRPRHHRRRLRGDF